MSNESGRGGGDLAAAAADLRAALNIDSSLPPAWTNRAVVLARQGREREAAVARERAAARGGRLFTRLHMLPASWSADSS